MLEWQLHVQYEFTVSEVNQTCHLYTPLVFTTCIVNLVDHHVKLFGS